MAIEALGGDPGEVERGLIVENAKRSDFIQKMLMQRIQQRLGMGEEQALQSIGAGPDGMPAGMLPPGMPACRRPRCPRGWGRPSRGCRRPVRVCRRGSWAPPVRAAGCPRTWCRRRGRGCPCMQPGQGQAIPGGLPSQPPGSPVLPGPPNGRPPTPGRPG